MLPKFHILFGFLASLIFYFFFPEIPLNLIVLFFISSFIFDVDHYIYFIFTKRSFNFFKAYKYFRYDLREIAIRNKIKKINYLILPFHLIEFILLLGIFSFYFISIKFIFLGLIFHMFIDWIYDLRLDKKDKKYKRVFSIIYYAITNKRSSKKIKK